MRKISVFALAGVLLAAIAIALAAPYLSRSVEAHASLVRSNPQNNEQLRAAPIRVVLVFSEPIERRLTQIEVFDADENRVDDGDLAFDDSDANLASIGLQPLKPGVYFVRYNNVSLVDSHPWDGAYPFIVTNKDGSLPEGISLDNLAASTGGSDLLPKPIDSALKWLSLIAVAAVAGAAFFLVAVLRPAAAFLRDERYRRVLDDGERWVVTLAHVLLPVAFVALAYLVLLTVTRFETSTGLWEYLSEVRTGRYRSLSLVLLVIGLVGADMLYLSRGGRLRQAGMWALAVACLGALFTYSMVSHGATGEGKFWSVASDFLHLAASAMWLGALVMLPPLLRQRHAGLGDDERFLFLANVFDRFSVVASISVIVVLATGVFNGLVQMPSWDAFTGTTYGKVLLWKLVLMAPLLVIAGVNAFVLKPRLVSVIDRLYQEGGEVEESERPRWDRDLARLRAWLPRTVLVEIALVLAVFGAVAVLTQTSTARSELASARADRNAQAKFDGTATAGDLEFTLEITPNTTDVRNEYVLNVRNADGTPATTITFARLRVEYTESPGLLPRQEILLTRSAEGQFSAQGVYFTQPGAWDVEASIRRSDGDDVTTSFVSNVPRLDIGDRRDGGAFTLPFTSLGWNEVLGAALALCGAVLVIYRRELRWLAPSVNRLVTTGGSALLLVGAVLAFAVRTGEEQTSARRSNPIAPTFASIDAGRVLYQQNCLVCHGVNGRGDGPGAPQLNPPPADFRVHMPQHPDWQFFNFISDGLAGTAMPAWRDKLSDEEIWNTLNYLRASFGDIPAE